MPSRSVVLTPACCNHSYLTQQHRVDTEDGGWTDKFTVAPLFHVFQLVEDLAWLENAGTSVVNPGLLARNNTTIEDVDSPIGDVAASPKLSEIHPRFVCAPW